MEFKRNQVDNLFEQVLGRHAEEGASTAFSAELQKGVSDLQILAQLMSSNEYFNHSLR